MSVNVGLGTFDFEDESYSVVITGADETLDKGWINCIIVCDNDGARLMQNCKKTRAIPTTGTIELQHLTTEGIVTIPWPEDWEYRVEVL